MWLIFLLLPLYSWGTNFSGQPQPEGMPLTHSSTAVPCHLLQCPHPEISLNLVSA